MPATTCHYLCRFAGHRLGPKGEKTEDYLQLAVAGSSLVLDASGKDVDELLEIAVICAESGGYASSEKLWWI
jgi:hypothetical protein